MNQTFISVSQIIVSILLITAVLLQQQGSGAGSAFGGGGFSYHTKRGFEKVLFTATIVLGLVFVVLAVLSLIYAI